MTLIVLWIWLLLAYSLLSLKHQNRGEKGGFNHMAQNKELGFGWCQ